jgi:hypothetical protein
MENEIKMFGCTKSDLIEMLEDSIGSYEMLAMGIMSDAQHVMAHGDTETARQFINKAKWVLQQTMKAKMAA